MVYMVLGLLTLSLSCLADPQQHASGIPVLDLSQPPFTHNFVPDIFPPPTVTPDPLEYLESRQDDLDEAIYAGFFAKELQRLERLENDIFTNFISDGFVSDEVPRQLPKLLIRLSRKTLPRNGFFDQAGGPGVPGAGINSLSHSSVSSFSSSRGRSGGSAAAVAGVGAPGPAKGRTGAMLPIEKGRLVTKTTTTDFGSPFPFLSSRTGRIHENNFRFPSEPLHSQSFLTHKSPFI